MSADEENLKLLESTTEMVSSDAKQLRELTQLLGEAYDCQRRTKKQLALEQQLLKIAQEEMDETLRTIEADRQKIIALQQEQTITVKHIKDAMSKDMKKFEGILQAKQPDLLSYCTDLSSTRECLQAIRSIRLCKHHIQLAESLIANRYGTLLADRNPDGTAANTRCQSGANNAAIAGSLVTMSPLGYMAFAAAAAASSAPTDGAAKPAQQQQQDSTVSRVSGSSAKKLRRLSLQSTGPSGKDGKTSCTSSPDAGVDIVRIEICDRDTTRSSARDQQQLKPLSSSSSCSSKSQQTSKL